MGHFRIEGKNGYICIRIEEVFGFPNQTSHFGGYDVRGRVELKSCNYCANGELWFSTGDVYTFYLALSKIMLDLNSTLEFNSSEGNLSVKMEFNKQGQVRVSGRYQERWDENNELMFQFESDQSYFISTLEELKGLVDRYGGLQGV